VVELFETLLYMRRQVSDIYSDDGPRFRPISELRLTLSPTTISETLSGLEESRLHHRIDRVSTRADYGDCVFVTLLEQLSKQRCRKTQNGDGIFLPQELTTVAALRECCELEDLRGKPLELAHLEQIAEKLVWTNSRNGPEKGVRLFIWNRLNNLYQIMPPPDEEDEVQRLQIHILARGGHAETWKNTNETKRNVAKATSMYTAYIEDISRLPIAEYFEQYFPETELTLADYKLQLFCDYQHLQPNTQAIEAQRLRWTADLGNRGEAALCRKLSVLFDRTARATPDFSSIRTEGATGQELRDCC
jgi:hypothetical protein